MFVAVPCRPSSVSFRRRRSSPSPSFPSPPGCHFRRHRAGVRRKGLGILPSPMRLSPFFHPSSPSQKLRHSAVGRRVLHFQKTIRPIRVRAHITQTDRQHQNTCQVIYSRDYSSHACLTPVRLSGVAEGFLIFILSVVVRKIFLVDVHSSSASSANYTQPTSTKEAIADRTMGTTT